MTPIVSLLVGILIGQASALESQVKARPTAAGFRSVAFAEVDAGDFSKASQYFESAAERYETLGDSNAAKVLRDQSLRYSSDVQVFLDRPAEASGPQMGRLEPESGCYYGVNIEADDESTDPSEFDDRVGKSQSLFFIYHRYGDPFPFNYAEKLKRLGAGIQIAMEPSDLDQVQDDEYLKRFAADAVKSEIPVFLRFASEMNGDWTHYHNNPAKYIEKFRLVASEMHASAPNVAMVWCPNEIPQSTIDSYFPGDDAVDWVGVNFYSVIFNDGNRSRASDWRNPTDSLKYIYLKYASKHPMMIGEWGATHESIVDHKDRTDFAKQKIAQLYSALPREFPRIKAVLWLSMNTEEHAEGDRKLNDFSLTDSPEVLKAYAKATASSYYLDRVNAKAGSLTVPLLDKTRIQGTVTLSFLARSYDPRNTVKYVFGKSQEINGGSVTGSGIVQVDTTQLNNGFHKLVMEVRDPAERVVASKSLNVIVDNSSGTIH